MPKEGRFNCVLISLFVFVLSFNVILYYDTINNISLLPTWNVLIMRIIFFTRFKGHFRLSAVSVENYQSFTSSKSLMSRTLVLLNHSSTYCYSRSIQRWGGVPTGRYSSSYLTCYSQVSIYYLLSTSRFLITNTYCIIIYLLLPFKM